MPCRRGGRQSSKPHCGRHEYQKNTSSTHHVTAFQESVGPQATDNTVQAQRNVPDSHLAPAVSAIVVVDGFASCHRAGVVLFNLSRSYYVRGPVPLAKQSVAMAESPTLTDSMFFVEPFVSRAMMTREYRRRHGSSRRETLNERRPIGIRGRECLKNFRPMAARPAGLSGTVVRRCGQRLCRPAPSSTGRHRRGGLRVRRAGPGVARCPGGPWRCRCTWWYRRRTSGRRGRRCGGCRCSCRRSSPCRASRGRGDS